MEPVFSKINLISPSGKIEIVEVVCVKEVDSKIIKCTVKGLDGKEKDMTLSQDSMGTTWSFHQEKEDIEDINKVVHQMMENIMQNVVHNNNDVTIEKLNSQMESVNLDIELIKDRLAEMENTYEEAIDDIKNLHIELQEIKDEILNIQNTVDEFDDDNVVIKDVNIRGNLDYYPIYVITSVFAAYFVARVLESFSRYVC